MDVLGLLVSVAGFGIAIWQVVKARRSADAARDAALGARQAMAGALLLGLLPQLTAAESDLRLAARSNNTEMALRALERWRQATPGVRAYLSRRGILDNDLAVRLSRCAGLANDAKDALIAGSDVSPAAHAFLPQPSSLVVALADKRSILELEGGGP